MNWRFLYNHYEEIVSSKMLTKDTLISHGYHSNLISHGYHSNKTLKNVSMKQALSNMVYNDDMESINKEILEKAEPLFQGKDYHFPIIENTLMQDILNLNNDKSKNTKISFKNEEEFKKKVDDLFKNYNPNVDFTLFLKDPWEKIIKIIPLIEKYPDKKELFWSGFNDTGLCYDTLYNPVISKLIEIEQSLLNNLSNTFNVSEIKSLIQQDQDFTTKLGEIEKKYLNEDESLNEKDRAAYEKECKSAIDAPAIPAERRGSRQREALFSKDKKVASLI